ncbi:MAG: hypothetical protein Pg6C_09250 [Treponemataceae bacterium]|nr:MAG: hypothetical protein Pg6C_09250 [Treponemataceae bacterium]
MKSLPILYESDTIIVINKPCGIAVQGGSGIVNSADIILARQLGAKVFPAHRLDKDTAGILVMAKSSASARGLAAAFAVGIIVKEYIAFCLGIPPRERGFFETPAGKKGEKKPALTEYRVEGQLASDPVLTRIRLCLKTGRTHQIRQQLAEAGCPVAADDKYGDFAKNRLIKKTLGIKKLQLAAVKLILPAALCGQKIVLQTGLPEHMIFL